MKITGKILEGSDNGVVTNIIQSNIYEGWGLQIYIHKSLKCEVSIFNSGTTSNHGGVLVAAKLEVGEESTLAYLDSEGKYQIRDIFDKEEEKLKCYRYLQVYIAQSYQQVYFPVGCAWDSRGIQIKTKHDFIVPMKNPVIHYYKGTSYPIAWYIGGIWSDGNRHSKLLDIDDYNIKLSIWTSTDKDCIVDIIFDNTNENWISLNKTLVLNSMYQPVLNCRNGNGYYFTGDF